MIIWLTCQPGHGKTVLAEMLKDYIEHNHQHRKIHHIDGDDLREVLVNKDYSRQGRENNIRTAQSIALYLESKGYKLVVNNIGASEYQSFEDWYIHPDLIEIDRIKPIININNKIKLPKDIFLL